MYEFTYHKPASLADAAKLLGAEEAKLVAGGMTLVPTLKLRLAKPSDLVDLARDRRAERASRKKAAG